MLGPITTFCLRYRSVVIAATFGLVIAGAMAWLRLPIDAYPEISPVQAKVILKVPGMTPEEIEQRVVRPIELEMLSIPNKRILRSVSKYGIADITVDFEEKVNIYWARQQITERLNQLLPDLPSTVSGGLAPISTPLSEMFMFTIEGNFPLAEKRRLLDWVIRPELRTIPGVADVNALGGEVASFEVIPHPGRMAAKGISIQDVRESLLANNANDGAGRLTAGEEHLVVRVEGAIRTLDDLRQIRVQRTNTNGSVALDEIATIRTGSLTRYGAVTANGSGETVQGVVLGLRGANARVLVDNVERQLSDVQKRLPEGMTLKPFYNRGNLVSDAAQTVISALLEASILVVVVLYFLLGNLRAALVVAAALPLSILGTFILMNTVGITANLMSLGGLAIGLGMLIDGAVVIVENIESHLERHSAHNASDRLDLIVNAVREVGTPLFSGILIIALVFVPLLSLEGLEGKLFSPVALTIVIALACSLVIAFTVIPVIAYLLLHASPGATPRLMVFINSWYLRLRERAWAKTRMLYQTALGFLIIAVIGFLFIGKIFLPTLDEGSILVQLQKTASIALDTSTSIDTRMQQEILKQVPEVKSIVARTGSDELGLDPMGLNETDMFLVLTPRDDWNHGKEDIIARLRGVLEGFPGLIYVFTQPIEMRVSEMLTGTRGDLAIKVFGHDLTGINTAALKIAAAMKSISGATEVLAPRPEGLPYLNFRINRAVAGQAGLSVEDVQSRLRAQLEGQTVGIVIDGIARTPLMIRGNETIRNSPASLKELVITGPDGRSWPVAALAEIENIEGPIRVDHEQSQRYATVQVSVHGRDLSSFVEEAQKSVAALGLPKELRIVWGGQFENQQRAMKRLAIVVPICLGIIFMVLMLTLGSARHAGIVMLNIPFALVGGVFAIALTGQYLSVPAIVGFIALLGIAVLNGLVLVSHLNERQRQGEAMDTVIRLGTERRLRPVIMTAVITGLGMLPLLLATGPGSEIQRPLAIVVLGGLVSSTLITLFLLPKVYEQINQQRTRLDRRPSA
ncbi:MAG: efflux RND transporter permease subunit [Burkholderiaceae bacterium]|nr:efflux RND transporter permease subunit [Burkholderiaceae bacterium]